VECAHYGVRTQYQGAEVISIVAVVVVVMVEKEEEELEVLGTW
jgi:hypothetical protein